MHQQGCAKNPYYDIYQDISCFAMLSIYWYQITKQLISHEWDVIHAQYKHNNSNAY